MATEPVFVDTNIFLRYLTDDVPHQADAVEQLLQQAAQGEIRLITNSWVIAEIIWTLDSYYGLSKEHIQDKILTILNTPGLDVVDKDLVFQAIHWYNEKNVDFLDAFNAAWILNQGMKAVYTFDRRHFTRFEGIIVKVPEKQKN
ncbi:MAG: PIN domain nuclease [Desulfobacca sp.]|nr:PIN domain nuclease [Desulfobacca sp.]